jgi:1-acyl-sn-glycerol-3-phosphate acyltransferase
MNALRNIIFYLAMILVTIPLCYIAIVLSFFDRKGLKIHSTVAVPWAKLMLLFSGVKVKAEGLNRLEKGKQYIFATNHQSYFDILALLSKLPVPFAFVMKEELMEAPLLGRAMAAAGYLGISREDPRRAISGMNKAIEKVKEGFSLVIFPEGTRSLDGTLGEFKRGAFNLALKTRLDIVPVTIDGSFRVVKKGRLFINKAKFRLVVGSPISTRELGKRQVPELVQRVRANIQRELRS